MKTVATLFESSAAGTAAAITAMQAIAINIARRCAFSPATLAYNMNDVQTSQIDRYMASTRAKPLTSACSAIRSVRVAIDTTTTRSKNSSSQLARCSSLGSGSVVAGGGVGSVTDLP